MLYVVVWVVAQLVSHTNFDPTGDMIENFIWGQSFAWGQLKHPPLVGWVTGAWFELMPRSQWAYHLLAYTNAAIGLLGVAALARHLGLGAIGRAACLMLALTLPFSSLAGKLNANTILLSLWPWLVVAWLGAMQSTGVRALSFAVLLGLLTAASLMAKYYSGLMFLALFVLTIGSKQGRTWLRRGSFWLALVVFVICLLPHLNWLVKNDFAPLYYVQAQGTGGLDFVQMAKFSVIPLVYSLLALVGCLLLVPRFHVRYLWKMWLPQQKVDVLFILTVLPFALSLGFGLTGFVSLSSPWAIPLVFCFTLLWLRNLTGSLAAEELESVNQRAQNIMLGFLCVVLVLSPIYAWHQGKTGEDNYYLPTLEAVQQTELLWFQRIDADYRWVGGDYQDAGAVAFYGESDARYLYVLPNQPKQNGLVFCHLGKVQDNKVSNLCTERAERWSRNFVDKVTKIQFTVLKQGPRFFTEVPHSYRVYFYED